MHKPLRILCELCASAVNPNPLHAQVIIDIEAAAPAACPYSTRTGNLKVLDPFSPNHETPSCSMSISSR